MPTNQRERQATCCRCRAVHRRHSILRSVAGSMRAARRAGMKQASVATANRMIGAMAKTFASRPDDSVEFTGHCPSQKHGTGDAQRYPCQRQQNPAQHEQAQDASGRGAKRRPGRRFRRGAERPNTPSVRRRRPQPAPAPSSQRARAAHPQALPRGRRRMIASYVSNSAPTLGSIAARCSDRCDERRRIRRRASHDKRAPAPDPLFAREVDGGLGRMRQSAEPHVANDPDDVQVITCDARTESRYRQEPSGSPESGSACRLDLARKELARERFVDDRHAARIRADRRPRTRVRPEADLHGVEESGLTARSIAANGASCDVLRRDPAARIACRPSTRRCRAAGPWWRPRLDTGQRLDASSSSRKNVAIGRYEPGSACGPDRRSRSHRRVPGHVHRGGQKAIRRESRVCRGKVAIAANQQSRADHQQHGERDLGHHESTQDPQRRRTACGTRGGFVDSG